MTEAESVTTPTCLRPGCRSCAAGALPPHGHSGASAAGMWQQRRCRTAAMPRSCVRGTTATRPRRGRTGGSSWHVPGRGAAPARSVTTPLCRRPARGSNRAAIPRSQRHDKAATTPLLPRAFARRRSEHCPVVPLPQFGRGAGAAQPHAVAPRPWCARCVTVCSDHVSSIMRNVDEAGEKPIRCC